MQKNSSRKTKRRSKRQSSPIFALPLSDPLWQKLDDAHRDRDIPTVIAALTKEWDGEEANPLFWDCLCHQGTCYGATYAAIPHLLVLAQASSGPETKKEIALFLGHVARAAFTPGGSRHEDTKTRPQGLPDTLAGWDKKQDPYRSLAAYAKACLGPEIDNSDTAGVMPYSRQAYQEETLARYTELLARPAVTTGDLTTIEKIRAVFFTALPEIADLCAKIYSETEDASLRPHLLAGVAAASGDGPLSDLFDGGDEGAFACPNCNQGYHFQAFGSRFAIYAEPPGAQTPQTDRAAKDLPLHDYQDGAPNHADSFITPCETLPESPTTIRILRPVSATNDARNLARLRNFKGSWRCTGCKAEAPVS